MSACRSRFEHIFNVANDRLLPSGDTEDLVIRADDSSSHDFLLAVDVSVLFKGILQPNNSKIFFSVLYETCQADPYCSRVTNVSHY